jgi:transposase
MACVIQMSDRELTRLRVMIDLADDRLTVDAAAALMGLGRRQIYRLRRVFSADGAAGLTSRKRGRPSNRKHGEAFRATVLSLVREHYNDFGPTLAVEKLVAGHGLRIGVETLRQWMMAERLRTCLQDHVGRVLAVSDLAKAIRYAIRHWPGLTVFLEDGRVEMDTNVVERAIRPNTLTRKNALFAGNDGGAVHWAIAMTLIQTAKLNGVNPMAYLADVLERVVSGRTKQNEMHTLLPWNWTASTSATITSQAA